MKDFEIIKADAPLIETNFEIVKESLVQTLEKYKGLVVTEKTYQDAKSQQKNIAGLRRKVDEFRKDTKAKLSKPITDFENQCKELIALIEDVEKPIKEGISVFDQKRRDAQREVAERIIKDTVEEYGLNEKYAPKLTVNEKWTNLTITESEVKFAVMVEAESLMKDQKAEAEQIEIISRAIESANTELKTKMAFAEFQHLINLGMSTSDILERIRLQKEKIRMSERVVEPSEAQNDTRMPEPQENAPSKSTGSESANKVYWGRLYITGSKERIDALLSFLNGGKYEYRLEGTGTV